MVGLRDCIRHCEFDNSFKYTRWATVSHECIVFLVEGNVPHVSISICLHSSLWEKHLKGTH